MSDIIQRKIFFDTGSYQREKEDLSYCLFENHNFFHLKRHISFFRSDFRGSKFSVVHFYKNNLDRADFISANFTDCKFELTNFGGCEIKNCYFENTDFINNHYKDSSIHQCIFYNCNFTDEKFLISMFDCSFINCRIINCSFEMSTTERLSFNNCLIENVDLATMHAEMHSFVDCTLNQVCIGSCFFFGYLICRTSIEKIDFLYRGEKASIELNDIKKLIDQYRYFECFNASILLQKYEISLSIIEKAFLSIINCPYYIRKSEIDNILNAIIFYYQNSAIPFRLFLDIFHFITNYNWQIFDLTERISYLSKVESLKMLFNCGDYDLDYIYKDPIDTISNVEIQYQTDDFNLACKDSDILFSTISSWLQIDLSYSLINSRKGSWILIFAIPTVLALFLPKIIKEYHNTICTIRVTRSFSDKIVHVLQDDSTKTDFKDLVEAAKLIVSDDKKENLIDILKKIKMINIDL